MSIPKAELYSGAPIEAVAVDVPPPTAPPARGGFGSIQTEPSFRGTAGAVPTRTNVAGARAFLNKNQWPPGMIDACLKNMEKFAYRYIVCDDSGSMSINDGKRLVSSGSIQKFVPCTRWSELCNSLRFHMELARDANAPTQFRLLNAAEPMVVGVTREDDDVAFNTLTTIFSESPSGGTPLCKHIRAIVDEIRGNEAQLRANRQMACVIIATDGESSDGDIASAMKPLASLPVWVVVRLCTDDEKIVSYWNNIDDQLELDMDVLDDFEGESQEVYSKNPWLTYGEPLHRLREFGILAKELDLIDESLLSLDQMKKVAHLIYGKDSESWPPAEVDLKGFLQELDKTNKAGSMKTYNCVSKRLTPWINSKELRRLYGEEKCILS